VWTGSRIGYYVVLRMEWSFDSDTPAGCICNGSELGTKSLAQEPEGSSPYSQDLATGRYPEQTGSTLHSPSQSP
jgi:hypothetical protein